MKKMLLPALVCVIILAASCKKETNTNNVSASTWSFKGTNYSGDTCELYNGFFEVWPNGNEISDYIFISFPNNSLPSGGTYNVVNSTRFWSSTLNNVALVSYKGDSSTYVSTGFGSNQTLTVTVYQPGKVKVTGTGIELKNGLNDSSGINFTMIQTF